MRKVALITDSTSGLGITLLMALYEEGYKLYAVSENKGMLDFLSTKYTGIHFLCGSLENVEFVKSVLETINEVDGKLDVMINIASV